MSETRWVEDKWCGIGIMESKYLLPSGRIICIADNFTLPVEVVGHEGEKAVPVEGKLRYIKHTAYHVCGHPATDWLEDDGWWGAQSDGVPGWVCRRHMGHWSSGILQPSAEVQDVSFQNISHEEMLRSQFIHKYPDARHPDAPSLAELEARAAICCNISFFEPARGHYIPSMEELLREHVCPVCTNPHVKDLSPEEAERLCGHHRIQLIVGSVLAAVERHLPPDLPPTVQ